MVFSMSDKEVKYIEVKEIEFPEDTDIKDALYVASKIANHDNCVVKFKLKGVEIKVHPHDSLDLLYNYFIAKTTAS